jgi:hypothetical protein
LFLKFTCFSSILSLWDMCMTAWVPCFMCVFVMLQRAFCDEDWIKGFIFLWSQSNYGGGQWQKRVSCLMVCPIFVQTHHHYFGYFLRDFFVNFFSLWCSVCNLNFLWSGKIKFEDQKAAFYGSCMYSNVVRFI